jgi:hypothetical protein
VAVFYKAGSFLSSMKCSKQSGGFASERIRQAADDGRVGTFGHGGFPRFSILPRSG